MARTYTNFDVTVRSEGPNFVLSAASASGSVEVSTQLPFSADELDRFIGVFDGEERRRLETDRYELTRDFGKRLYESFFTDEVRSLLADSMRAAEADSVGLRIRLRFDDAPTLVNVPWEYLYREKADDFVSLSNWTPVVRHLETEGRVLPAQITHPLKILVMISDPLERRGTLDVEREWSQLQRSLSDAESVQKASLTRLDTGRLDELQDALREDDYHVFHFIGHGTFSEADNDGALLLEDELGRSKIIAGRVLGDRLRDSRSMRLVVLNNCEGAATSAFDPFAGTAQSLLRKGIPAVVAMQFAVTDLSALAFSRGFYRSIIDGYPVDASVAEGRKAIDEGANRFEFGAPVLYLAADDGAVFDIAATPQPDFGDEPRPAIEPSSPTPAPPPVDAAAIDEVAVPLEAAPSDDDVVTESPVTAPDHAAEEAQGSSQQVKAESPASGEPDDDGSSTQAPASRWPIVAGLAAFVLALVVIFAVINSGDDPPGTTVAVSTSQDISTTAAPGTTATTIATTTGPPTTLPLVPVSDQSVATFTAVPLVIDGSDADWTSTHEMVSDNRVYDPGNDWDGQADLSGSWRLAWDEQFLYVFAEVRDEQIDHVTSGSLTWRGDAIAFNFDPDPSDNAPGDDLTGNESGVFISPFVEGAANGEWARLATNGRVPNEVFEVDDKTDSDGFLSATSLLGPEDDPTGYRLEARIPWSMLIGDRTPLVGDEFKMTLDVTDDDSGGNTQQTMFSNSPERTLENRAKPDVWELMTLA